MYIIIYIGISRIGMRTVAEAIAIGFLVHLVVNLMVLLFQYFQEVHMVEEVGEEEEEEWEEEEEGEEEEEEEEENGWGGGAAAAGE